MERQFFTLDVFSSKPLAGNPLAVVLDSEGLTDQDMQAIAAEFNLSETVFVSPPEDPSNRARLRIFTPAHELPFAGHPTVGTAVLLAQLDSMEEGAAFTLEENVGPVTCFVSEEGGVRSARFQMPKIPVQFDWSAKPGLVADALGLNETDIGFGDHGLAGWDGGVPYILIPVASLEAMRRIKVDAAKCAALEPVINGINANVYAYCAGGESDEASFHARMFAHSSGIPEDPATGSAVASFCGQIAALEMQDEETKTFCIEQGYEMGRPSQITLQVVKKGGDIASATISGEAVVVSKGILQV